MSVVARVVLVRSDGSHDAPRQFLGERSFVALPSPNDRLEWPTRDGTDLYRVLFVEHLPSIHPPDPKVGPPIATVVVEVI